MFYSNSRKLTLSGWLKNYDEAIFNDAQKLQYFLFLYEAFSKVAGDEKADFTHLVGVKD